MLPVPRFDPPLAFNDPPLEPLVWRPTPRLLPLVLWYLWIVGTSVTAVYTAPQGFGNLTNQFMHGMLIGHLLLTPAWVALAIRPIWHHLFAVFLSYLFILFIPYLSRNTKDVCIIFIIVAGTWSILRWNRVATLDLVLPTGVSGSRTLRLADRVQFSLRSLILLSAVVASGISLYLFFRESASWSFYKAMFFIAIPSELLFFWGMLGRASWIYRIPWLLVAIHHWCLLPVVEHGFQNWDQIYNGNSVTEWIGISLSQLVSLGLLRWAGYRIGMPKLRERVLPVVNAIEPQSPWNEGA